MKKVISILAVLILVIGCTMLPVSAEVSPEIDDVISQVEAEDANGDKVDIDFVRNDELDEDLKPDSKEDKIIAQYDVIVEGEPEYPITVTLKVDGVKKGSKVYILAKDEDGSVQYIEAEVLENGKIRFIMDKYYPTIAIVSDVKTSSNIGTSDPTGDYTLPAAMTLLLVSGAAIVFAKKKIEG